MVNKILKQFMNQTPIYIWPGKELNPDPGGHLTYFSRILKKKKIGKNEFRCEYKFRPDSYLIIVDVEWQTCN